MEMAVKSGVPGLARSPGIGIPGSKKGQIRGQKNVQKKMRNLLTGSLNPVIVAAHTVNTYYIER
jgi:hypothetical protein